MSKPYSLRKTTDGYMIKVPEGVVDTYFDPVYHPNTGILTYYPFRPVGKPVEKVDK
jgi:hypothetical protein